MRIATKKSITSAVASRIDLTAAVPTWCAHCECRHLQIQIVKTCTATGETETWFSFQTIGYHQSFESTHSNECHPFILKNSHSLATCHTIRTSQNPETGHQAIKCSSIFENSVVIWSHVIRYYSTKLIEWPQTTKNAN